MEVGSGLEGNYEVLVSTGAQRTTQTLACFLAALGQKVPGGVVVEEGLRSQIEDRWKAAYREAGSGELDALRSADPELVEQDSATLGLLCVGYSTASSTEDGPWWSATVLPKRPAVLGLTGEVVAPMAKGGGVLVESERFRVEPLG